MTARGAPGEDREAAVMDGVSMTPESASPASPLLDRITVAGYAEVPVVNSVPEPPDLLSGPVTAGDERSQRKARRKAERAERRRRRHPEKFRADFTAWVAIPWRDRPIEARLADFAVATGEAVLGSAAWRHPLLDGHRVRLDPAREAAEIAIGAYRLYCARRGLGAPPAKRFGVLPRSQGALGDAVQASYREKETALDDAWQALLRRLGAFDEYRRHLDELGPVLAAADTVEFLDGARFGEQVAQVVTGGASDDFAASDTSQLAHEAEALTQVLTRAGQQRSGVLPATSADPALEQ